MNKHQAELAGVYAAAVTPLSADGGLDREGLVRLLAFLAARGCHGAVLLGTTGEGPSFSTGERRSLLETALRVREEHPGFRLLAGTGTPALEETIDLTRLAFDLGFNAVLVLPPYYFRQADENGLYTWFERVLTAAVPADGALLGYHIPGVSGVPLSLALLRRLRDSFPERFAGLKDSSADPVLARQLGDQFGQDLVILTGTDRLLTSALQAGAQGCITALANLVSPALRQVWDAHQRGGVDPVAQAELDAARDVMERFPPAAALIKSLLSRLHGFAEWDLKPPLRPLAADTVERAAVHWRAGRQIA